MTRRGRKRKRKRKKGIQIPSLFPFFCVAKPSVSCVILSLLFYSFSSFPPPPFATPQRGKGMHKKRWRGKRMRWRHKMRREKRVEVGQKKLFFSWENGEGEGEGGLN